MGLLDLRAEHHYRDRTQTDKSMAGVTTPTFRCKRCKEIRSNKGRKRSGQGFLCSRCGQDILAAQQAKEASDG